MQGGARLIVQLHFYAYLGITRYCIITDFDTRCCTCKVCMRDHTVCQITAAAARVADIDLEDLVHPSETQR